MQTVEAMFKRFTFSVAQVPGFVQELTNHFQSFSEIAGMMLVEFGQFFYRKNIVGIYCHNFLPECYGIFPSAGFLVHKRE
jgi:hypothetical protein